MVKTISGYITILWDQGNCNPVPRFCSSRIQNHVAAMERKKIIIIMKKKLESVLLCFGFS
ncbi:hypothetical protein MtrunA17_Chr3g0108081 [Medicago truncatula]|uniref:Uncharacterized protein n=1 Tax=Medicago truncatula TaxID=3880 RepID=G7J2A6_MEDTR|nr:hypothetical protein MTR_3g062150 [Medicago truncatula]RHN67924.1 hypothetical protein MtrunA17_Chr3g0108081 [Medicago truncatula]